MSRTLIPHSHHLPEPSFSDTIAKAYAAEYPYSSITEVAVPSVTFQVTEDCPLACTYCYQINKSKNSMSIDIAKKAIDILLQEKDYFNCEPLGCTLDFIGGEPLLEIKLIEEIYEYFLMRCIELNHPWLYRHRISMCSNGVLYFQPEVQEFFKKYSSTLSFSISIDGTKTLHDTCRIFPNGQGSYDLAMKAVEHYRQHYGPVGTKLTIAPENLQYTTEAIIDMYNKGWHSIYANCVFEKGWELHHATEFYYQLKNLADYIDQNDLYSDLFVSLFDEHSFCPMDYTNEEDNRNWCGGTGKMLAVDYRGIFYPCLRYMPSSLGTEVEPLIIGDVNNGICQRDCEKCLKADLDAITASTQSTEECLNCPIARGCAWCSGYNYQETGSVNQRVTYICVMHKARALANAYYWNKFYQKHNIKTYYENYVPDEWALEIIPSEELNLIKNLILTQQKGCEN